MYIVTTEDFTIERVVNDLVVTSNSETEVGFTISFQKCDGSEEVVIDELSTLQGVYPFFGGEYDNGTYILRNKGGDEVVQIFNWGKLLNIVLKEIQVLLCKKCNDCKDCNGEGKKCIRYQNLYNYFLSYIYNEKPFWLNDNEVFSTEVHIFIQKAINLYTCYIKEQLCKVDIKKHISGEIIFTEELFKFYISIMYLANYYYAKYSMHELTTDEVTTLNLHYKYNSIKKCLSCVIDLDELENIYTGNVAHTNYSALFSIAPTNGERGLTENILVTYNIVSNDDIITSVTITNIGNVTGNIDAGTFNIMTSSAVSVNYVMTINFIRNGVPMTETIVREYDAYTPQWAGEKGEPDISIYDYDVLNTVIEKIVQPTSAITRTLTPLASYIWFVSTNPDATIRNSGFVVTIGEWDSDTAFMIKKNHILTLADGVTTANLTYYRSRELHTTSPQQFSIE